MLETFLVWIASTMFFLAGTTKLLLPKLTNRDSIRFGIPLRYFRSLGIIEIGLATVFVTGYATILVLLTMGTILLGAIWKVAKIGRWIELLHPVATLGVLLVIAILKLQ